MTKIIRVDEDTYAALAALKSEDESFDDLLGRLIEERRMNVREGAGLWAGTKAAQRARDARDELKQNADSV